MPSSKLTDLPEVTTPGDDDVVYIVVDPTGAQTPSKVKVSNLRGAVLDSSGTFVVRTSTQSIPDSTDTPILFPTEIYDDNNLHDTATNTSRITIAEDGRYLLFGGTEWASMVTPAGGAGCFFKKNGTAVTSNAGWVAGDNSDDALSLRTLTVVDLVAGDYVELVTHQWSGSSLNLLKAEFGVIRLGGGRPTVPYVEAHRDTNQSITSGTYTSITLPTEMNDPYGMFTAGGSDFVVPVGMAGIWDITARVHFAGNATGLREVYIEESTNWRWFGHIEYSVPASEWYSTVGGQFNLGKGDAFYVACRQTSGGALDVVSAYLFANYVGPV